MWSEPLMRHWFEQLPIAAPSVQARWATANAVEDGVGKRGFGEDVVPCSNRKLTGNPDRSSSDTVLDDLHEVTALAGVQALGSPILKNE